MLFRQEKLPYTNERPGGGRRQPTSDSKCLHLPSVVIAELVSVMAERLGGGRRQPTSDSKCLHLPSVAIAELVSVMAERPVSECNSSTKCLQHFVDALSPAACMLPGFVLPAP